MFPRTLTPSRYISHYAPLRNMLLWRRPLPISHPFPPPINGLSTSPLPHQKDGSTRLMCTFPSQRWFTAQSTLTGPVGNIDVDGYGCTRKKD